MVNKMKILLKGGNVVSEYDVQRKDILIEGEKIAKLGEGIEDPEARVIDVSNKLLFPGFIDAHTHFDLHVAGTVTADGFASGTRAALAGGTTVIIDFATQYKGQGLKEALEHWHSKVSAASCDYGFHLAITDWNEEIKRELEEVVKGGVTSFKLYMTYDEVYLDDGRIYEVLKRLGELKVFSGVHCENKYLIDALGAQEEAGGRLSPSSHPLSRPGLVEAEAVSRLFKIARLADARVMIVHLSSKEALEEVIEARKKGQAFFAETCPQYLLLDDSVYSLPDFEGAKYVLSPPIRKEEDSRRLWQALREGYIDTIATDHCSFTMEQKRAGEADFRKIPNGMPGVEARAEVLMGIAINREGLSYPQMCRLLSANAAKIYGLYPNKGVLQEGADADIVVWDPEYEWVMSADNQLSLCDYCPFEGRKIRGIAEKVFLHGKEAACRHKVILENQGKYLKRELPYV